MKKLFILLLVNIATIGIFAQENTLQQAADAYSKGDYNQASQLYEAALKEKGESASVYYNLGNCYYKLNKSASAILNYEKALLLDPGDGDIRFNLEIAKLKTVDKIEPVDEFFISSWISSIQNMYSTNQWAYIGISAFIILIGMLTLFFFSRKIILKKAGFYLGIGFLAICILANVFSFKQKTKLEERNTAIVFAATVTIKSSPDNSGTDLFVLHEGVKVKIKSKLGEWSEIIIPDGNVGWIKTSEIQVI